MMIWFALVRQDRYANQEFVDGMLIRPITGCEGAAVIYIPQLAT
jgi:hypothetical protein